VQRILGIFYPSNDVANEINKMKKINQINGNHFVFLLKWKNTSIGKNKMFFFYIMIISLLKNGVECPEVYLLSEICTQVWETVETMCK
jgi:hypothetical protein